MLARYLTRSSPSGGPQAASSFFNPARIQQLLDSLTVIKQALGYL
jgi:hypothetical protein